MVNLHPLETSRVLHQTSRKENKITVMVQILKELLLWQHKKILFTDTPENVNIHSVVRYFQSNSTILGST